ncbi:ATP-binding protein [Candidatus Poribacteria bacterium]
METVDKTRGNTEWELSAEEIRSLARFPVENPNPVMRIRKDGTIVYANDGSSPLLNIWDCQRGQCLSSTWRNFISDVLDSGESKEMEVPTGDRIFLLSFMPVADAGYIYAYGRDITERKRAEEETLKSEEMYRTIFEATGTAAVIIDEDTGIISLANTEFEKLSGYLREEIEGEKSWTEFLSESSLKKMKQYSDLREKDPGNAPGTCESELVDRTGKIRACLVTVSTIPNTGKSVIFIVDITERKEENERIQAAKMRSLRQLVAGLVHEMNNPTGTISSNNDITSRAVSKIRTTIAEDCPRGVQENKTLSKALDVLAEMNRVNQNATEDIVKTVTKLQRFVRLDEAEWQLDDIHDGIDNVVALMESEFSDRIKVTKNYGGIPKIYCSPSDLNQVFMSLLKNASEAIDGEGEIDIRTFAQDNHVSIAISDTGRGIPTEYMGRVFDPGFTTKGVEVGVGLGLPICHKIIVDEHKGRIDVSSQPGIGTTFTVTLPQHYELMVKREGI